MFTHYYTVTRPDTETPFWFDTPEANLPELFEDLRDQLISEGFLNSVTRIDAPNGLSMTRVVECNTPADFEMVLQRVEELFPGTYQERSGYCITHSHVVSVDNVIS